MKRFIIHKNDSERRENCLQFINVLDPNKMWGVEIKLYRKKRSNDQNAYIHAVPLKVIAEHVGETVEEMKEYLCGEFTGWVEYEVMGRKKTRPVKTTSQMDTKEMTDFIEYMQWFGSFKLNLYIPSPNEWNGEW
jgi:hypothetical protein